MPGKHIACINRHVVTENGVAMDMKPAFDRVVQARRVAKFGESHISAEPSFEMDAPPPISGGGDHIVLYASFENKRPAKSFMTALAREIAPLEQQYGKLAPGASPYMKS